MKKLKKKYTRNKIIKVQRDNTYQNLKKYTYHSGKDKPEDGVNNK